jgi:hypothetical protein
LDISDLYNLCRDENIVTTKHAKNRLVERGITIENIKSAIQTGEIIEQYENDKPFPSCLLLGRTEQNTHIHVVASVDNNFLYIITAYYPDENKWEDGFKNRKGQ